MSETNVKEALKATASLVKIENVDLPDKKGRPVKTKKVVILCPGIGKILLPAKILPDNYQANFYTSEFVVTVHCRFDKTDECIASDKVVAQQKEALKSK